MPKTPRRTRPQPERTEPVRSWSRGARPRSRKDANANGASASDPAAAPDAAANDAKRPGAENPRSSAYRALNDAYRLVDEYMRQGQTMAENIWLPLGRAGANAANGTNGTNGTFSFGAPDRFMRALGDMTLAWVEVMQGWTSAQGGGVSSKPTGSAGPFSAGRAPSASPSEPQGSPASTEENSGKRELTVSVEARGRVEVSVQLPELADLGALEVTELRPAHGKGKAITALLSVTREAALLRVVVPDGQPGDTYNGLFLETKSQKPRGTLCVVVLGGRGPKS